MCCAHTRLDPRGRDARSDGALSAKQIDAVAAYVARVTGTHSSSPQTPRTTG